MKKILSLILVVVLALSTVTFVFAEDAEPQPVYNTEAYESALDLMNSLLGEAVFGSDPASKVSRGQFVYGVAKIFGVPGDSSEEIVYSDVSVDNKYYAEIKSAHSAGWISSADKFNPDADITLAEAVKIMLTAADYGIMADAKGGYPTGYLSVAESVDLFTYVDVAQSGTLTVADATVMFENLMMADVFEIEAYGDTMDYRKGAEIYLEKLYDVYAVEGVVTSTLHSSVVMDAPFIKDNNEVTIDGIAYKCDYLDPALLGKYVVAYISRDGAKKTLYCAIPEDNAEFTVRASSFGGVKGNTFSYYDENDRSKTKKLDSSYKVIYNGRRVAKLESYMLEDIGATIRLLDNTGDSAYDIVFIDGYIYGEVTGVDFVNGYVGIETPGSVLNLSDEEEYICYISKADGAEMELFELKNGMIVAIKASADARIYDITECSEAVSGVVNELLPEDNQIRIGETDYKVSTAFKNRYMDANKAVFDLGDSINAAVGMHGELAYLISSSADLSYGYLLEIDADDSGFESEVLVKIYGSSGDFEIYELDEKVTVDGAGTKTKRENVVADLMSNRMSVIRYALGEDNKIIALDFASDDISGFGEIINPMNSLTKYYDHAAGKLRYRSGCQGFNSKAILSNATIMFVPSNEADRDDIEKFSMGSYNSLQSDNEYTCDIYDIDEYGMAGLVVVYSDAASDPNAFTYGSYIIENVTKALKDDIEGHNIYCWSNKVYYTLFLPSEVDVNKGDASMKELASGDIVRFKTQGDIIKNVYVDYYMKDGEMVFCSSGGANNTSETGENNVTYITGKVYSANASTMLISKADAESGEYSFEFGDLKAYKTASVIACYDTETRTVRSLTVDNLRTYRGYGDNADTVILRQRYTSPNCIIVIR